MTADDIARLVHAEVERISDAHLVERIRELLVEPYPVDLSWAYGAPGERFGGWVVLEHRESGTGIAFCPKGFGPAYPWGLVWVSRHEMGIGDDSGWFATLEAAMRDSMAWDGPNPDGYEVA